LSGAAEGEQPRANRFGRPQQQVAEELQRHVETPAELLDQAFIALGAPHQRRIAGVGERGARVAGQCVHHVAIAAVHQHIGDLLLDRRAAGDREQVRLAFLLRDADKIGGRQPGRLRQHRARHRDLVVMRETPDNVVRRLHDRREAIGKLCARLGFHPHDECASTSSNTAICSLLS
jgi:hypothetical protein